MPIMGTMTSPDPLWPSAATLLVAEPAAERRNVGLLGVGTYRTSVTPRSATSCRA